MKSFIEVTSIAGKYRTRSSLVSAGSWSAVIRKIHVNIYLLNALRRLHHYGLIFDAMLRCCVHVDCCIRFFICQEKNLSHICITKTSSTRSLWIIFFLFNFHDNIAIIRTNDFQSITIKCVSDRCAIKWWAAPDSHSLRQTVYSVHLLYKITIILS